MQYWTEETDKHIGIYNDLPQEKKNAYYEQYLQLPIYKLSEGIICNNGAGASHNIKNLVDQVQSSIVAKFPLFNASKGSGFSYFNTIGRNFFWQIGIAKKRIDKYETAYIVPEADGDDTGIESFPYIEQNNIDNTPLDPDFIAYRQSYWSMFVSRHFGQQKQEILNESIAQMNAGGFSYLRELSQHLKRKFSHVPGPTITNVIKTYRSINELLFQRFLNDQELPKLPYTPIEISAQTRERGIRTRHRKKLRNKWICYRAIDRIQAAEDIKIKKANRKKHWEKGIHSKRRQAREAKLLIVYVDHDAKQYVRQCPECKAEIINHNYAGVINSAKAKRACMACRNRKIANKNHERLLMSKISTV